MTSLAFTVVTALLVATGPAARADEAETREASATPQSVSKPAPSRASAPPTLSRRALAAALLGARARDEDPAAWNAREVVVDWEREQRRTPSWLEPLDDRELAGAVPRAPSSARPAWPLPGFVSAFESASGSHLLRVERFGSLCVGQEQVIGAGTAADRQARDRKQRN